MQSDQDQTRLALATLVACTVRTLDEAGVISRSRFEHFLSQAYSELRDKEADNLVALETLSWTREALKIIS